MTILLSKLKPDWLTNPAQAQLQQIYDLRVTAWATNPLFDGSRFPNGMSDAFDAQSSHWIVNHEDHFVAAARVTVGSKLSELPDHNVFDQTKLQTITTIVMLSRLVVHPDYRGLGLAQLMDDQRIAFLEQHNIPLTLAYAAPQRTAQLIKKGFYIIGSYNVQHMKLTGNEGEQVLCRQVAQI